MNRFLFPNSAPRLLAAYRRFQFTSSHWPARWLVPRKISFVTSCRARVARLTPCAPRSADSFPNGAHGVTRPTTSRNLFVTVIVFVLPGLVLSGCAGYKLGPTNGLAARDKSVQVNPFSNQTMEPRLGDAVTEQLRKALQRDGTYQVATRNDGDIVVSGVITAYQRQEMSFVPSDILTVRDYRVSLVARVTARERTSGKLILDQPVSGYTLVRAGADLTSAERQALPLLAADLAKNVTARLADGSW